MQGVLSDLQSVLDENEKVLARPLEDLVGYKEWGAQRQIIFARLQSQDFRFSSEDCAMANLLMKRILESDAIILARLKDAMTAVNRRQTAATLLPRIVATTTRSQPSMLLRRFA